MPMSKKCQNMRKKLQSMSYNMMIGYDIYDRFTMEHFPLRQSMILTTSFFCSRQYTANGLQTFGINRLNLIFKKFSTLYWHDN
jgi:hypothetical protein